MSAAAGTGSFPIIRRSTTPTSRPPLVPRATTPGRTRPKTPIRSVPASSSLSPRTPSEQLTQSDPSDVHASINCSTNFESLAKRLTEKLVAKDYRSAINILNNCAETRIRKQQDFNKEGIKTDPGHQSAIDVITNLLSVITDISIDTNSQYPLTIQFEPGTTKEKVFHILRPGERIPIAIVDPLGYTDKSGTRHSRKGGRKHTLKRKRNLRKKTLKFYD